MSVARLRSLTALASCALALASSPARAGSAMEFPETGAELLGRGGAWIARATDPLAVSFNPAGLAGQPPRVTFGDALTVRHACFSRVKAAGDTTADGVAPGGTYARVCDTGAVWPVGHFALAGPISRAVGVGAAILAPNGVVRSEWPDFVGGRAAPQRYLLLDSTAVFVTPTVGLGVRVLDELRVGASVQWGVAYLRSSRAAPGLAQDGMDPAVNDVKASVEVVDAFVPGATLGALWAPAPSLEVAGWFRWSAPIDARGDVRTAAGYFSAAAARGDGSKIVRGDSARSDCGQPGSTACAGGDVARVKIPIPMEAKLGVRWRSLRRAPSRMVDPMRDERFDVEVDFTWANDRALDAIEVRFPALGDGRGAVPVPGTAGALPTNADVAHHYRDVAGVRVGGDVNVIPDRLALRAGAFLETAAQDPTLQNIDFASTRRGGLSAGATLRVPVPELGERGSIDFSVGAMILSIADADHRDPNGAGLAAVAGTSPYRTSWPVNLGTIEQSAYVLGAGTSVRF